MRIGLIGTGMLGSAVGMRLIGSGHALSVYNRTPEKTGNLESAGAVCRATPGLVAQESELVITCVRDAGAVKDVSFGDGGIVSGRHDGLTVADMSTIDPDASREIAGRFRRDGIGMLETPVMGGPDLAVDGQLTMMAAGERAEFEKYRAVLETVACRSFYLGGWGTAQTVKLAMNLQIAMLALSLSEGITLTRSAGVDPGTFLDVLNSTYFKTGMSQNKARRMIRGSFEPTFTLKNLKKDLRTINGFAARSGTGLPMGTRAEQVYQEAEDAGFGGLDYTGILAYLGRAAAGTRN